MFQCVLVSPLDFATFPSGPDSDQYIPCTAELCPFINESDFAVQISKDVATVRDSTPPGTPVNLEQDPIYLNILKGLLYSVL